MRSIAPTTCTLTPVTTTINSQSDMTGLANCVVVDGSIMLSSSTPSNITLNGIQNITGDLIAVGAGSLALISSSTLTAISGSLTLQNLQSLQLLDFPELVNIGTINWYMLPKLTVLVFGGTILGSNVTITGTSLQIVPDIRPTQFLYIQDNPDLANITIQSTSLTIGLIVSQNGGTSSFPNLTWATNITAGGGSNANFPALVAVNNSLVLDTTSISDFNASQLQTIGSVSEGLGDFSVMSNPDMTSCELPSLQSVGGALQIVGNAGLSILAFPSLQTIGQNSILSGGIST